VRRRGKDVLDVFDGEHDATYAQRVRRCVLGLGADRRRRVELHQLKPAVAVRGPHHRDVDSDVVEADDTVHPTSLDWRLDLQLHTKFDKEHRSSPKVFDNDADVVHPLKGHLPERNRSTRPERATVFAESSVVGGCGPGARRIDACRAAVDALPAGTGSSSMPPTTAQQAETAVAAIGPIGAKGGASRARLLAGRSACQLSVNFLAEQAGLRRVAQMEKGPLTRAFAVGAGVSGFTT
jgi:hypothetical protein